jgi:hypothetical protein
VVIYLKGENEKLEERSETTRRRGGGGMGGGGNEEGGKIDAGWRCVDGDGIERRVTRGATKEGQSGKRGSNT